MVPKDQSVEISFLQDQIHGVTAPVPPNFGTSLVNLTGIVRALGSLFFPRICWREPPAKRRAHDGHFDTLKKAILGEKGSGRRRSDLHFDDNRVEAVA
jgi:hypothetical protein